MKKVLIVNMILLAIVQDGRALNNPIRAIKKEPEHREQRGFLTREHFVGLITHTRQSKEVCRFMAGPERSYLYLVAGVTGLRRSELQRLIWSDLELAGNHPAVILDGTRTKNNQDAYQPLPVTVAGQLAKWKQSRGALDSDKVFPHMTEHCRAGEMIQSDLVVMLKAEQDQLSSGRRKEIERPVCDDAGRKIDFHSLRVSYITWLADSNIPAKTVQKLARHSTLALTFGVYAKPVLSTEHLAVASLPEVIDEQQPTAAVG